MTPEQDYHNRVMPLTWHYLASLGAGWLLDVGPSRGWLVSVREFEDEENQ